MRRVFITGTAGFIGFHLARRLLESGVEVHGYDAVTDYYSPALKRDRQSQLAEHDGFRTTEARLEDMNALRDAVVRAAPDAVVHLAAQAGVRYSVENPRAYIETNVVGTFNLLEAVRETGGVGHLLFASTSSAYGANPALPFRETDRAAHPVSTYAATKIAGEALAHTYAGLHDIPTTAFRFFTVYGPWGRPDMAPALFADAMLSGRPIDIYNHGRMRRDFTYVDDLVEAVRALMDVPPRKGEPVSEADNLSPVAPYRVVNIGNADTVALMDFIEAFEDALGVRAERRMMDMQPGDVPATWADTTLLGELTGQLPATDYREGVRRFVAWYRDYYGR